MNRALTEQDLNLITLVAKRIGGSDGAQLLADSMIATARSPDGDRSRILFDIPGYIRPTYKGQHSYGVEGRMFDSDGVELSVLLHADENGRLLELEFVRWGEGDVIGPDWSTIKVA